MIENSHSPLAVQAETVEIPDVSPSASSAVAERQLAEIRDLLFGEQMRFLQAGITTLQRQMLERLEELTQRFSQNLEQTRRDYNARLDALAQHVEQLNQRQENRLATDIDDVNVRLQSIQIASEQRDVTLEQQLQDMAATLNEHIGNRARELMEQLTQTRLELRDSKADRKTLASLLDRMATELNQDG